MSNPELPMSEIAMGSDVENKETEDSISYPFDGIIVFGHGWSKPAKVGGGWQLSQEAMMRVVGAYELWRQGLAPKIILTGGQPGEGDKAQYGDDIMANSEQMAEMLRVRFHVPDEAIVTENRSTKTVDNVGYALQELQSVEEQMPEDQRKSLTELNFLCVSTGYHLARIKKIMDKLGLKSDTLSAESALNSRAEQFAIRMAEKERERGVDEATITKNMDIRRSRYDHAMQRIFQVNQGLQSQMAAETKYASAMDNFGFWGPLALKSLPADELLVFSQRYGSDIKLWLERHPELELSFEDILECNFDPNEIVKARELPR